MNILHLNTTKEWRGGDMQMLTTYKLLAQQDDIKQTIFCPQDSKIAQQLQQQNIPHLATEEKHKLSLRYFKAVLDIAKSRQVTIVHAHDSYALTIATAVSLFYKNIKIIYSRKRDNRFKSNPLRRFKFNNQKLAKIVCVSKAVTKVFDGVVRNDEKISVIYDGVNVDYLAQQTNQGILHTEFGLSADTLIIGNVAAHKPEKDLITFIDAAALALRYSPKKLCFMVIGDGPMKAQLIRYAQQKGVSEHIIFCGFRHDMAQILPEFSCLMMSSKSEGLPLAIFEAFACKVPVVATAAGGIGEVIQQENSGMISPIGDSLALAENLIAVLSNKELRDHITHKAFELVREKFSLEVMRNNYYELYKSIAQPNLQE